MGLGLTLVPPHHPKQDNGAGIQLVTAANRRNPPQCVDSKIHHNNLINNILAKIQANHAGAQDAVMLDVDGFVSETNATNLFMIKNGAVLTPHADACLPGITRQTVMDLCKGALGLPLVERRISLAEFHAADEVVLVMRCVCVCVCVGGGGGRMCMDVCVCNVCVPSLRPHPSWSDPAQFTSANQEDHPFLSSPPFIAYQQRKIKIRSS